MHPQYLSPSTSGPSKAGQRRAFGKMPTVSSTCISPYTSRTPAHIWRLERHTGPQRDWGHAPLPKAGSTSVSNVAAGASLACPLRHQRARQGRRVTTDAPRGKRAPWYDSLGMTRSSDSQTADIQIQFFFTSSPPFSTAENLTETVNHSLNAVTDQTQLRQTPQSIQRN